MKNKVLRHLSVSPAGVDEFLNQPIEASFLIGVNLRLKDEFRVTIVRPDELANY
jgi:hypothetical protein